MRKITPLCDGADTRSRGSFVASVPDNRENRRTTKYFYTDRIT